MRNLKMIVAYVGTRYAGWQVQPGRPTIQGVLEDRIARMLRESIRIAGAGRTDAGVHARGQGANFPTGSRLPAGLYFVCYDTPEGRFVRRVAVAR